MPRQIQFGARKNPAPSSRQHGLCLAADTDSENGPVNETLQTQESLGIDQRTNEPQPSMHAAPQRAATGKRSNDDSHLLTVSEVAQLLQVPVSWIDARTRHRAKGRLPAYRLGKYWRFDRDQVLAWVRRQCKDFRAA